MLIYEHVKRATAAFSGRLIKLYSLNSRTIIEHIKSSFPPHRSPSHEAHEKKSINITTKLTPYHLYKHNTRREPRATEFHSFSLFWSVPTLSHATCRFIYIYIYFSVCLAPRSYIQFENTNNVKLLWWFVFFDNSVFDENQRIYDHLRIRRVYALNRVASVWLCYLAYVVVSSPHR